MDPLRIAVRSAVAYILLLILMRLSGKRTIRHAGTVEFTVVLIIGDLVDDLIWAEVEAAKFVVAAGTLMMVHVVLDVWRYRSGSSA